MDNCSFDAQRKFENVAKDFEQGTEHLRILKIKPKN